MNAHEEVPQAGEDPWDGSVYMSASTIDRTHQYNMEASSPCSSVPAATIIPLAETSHERRPGVFPDVRAFTVWVHSAQASLSSVAAAPGHVLLYSLCKPTDADRSSQALTMPSLPQEMRTGPPDPAKTGTALMWVIDTSCPGKTAIFLRSALS